MRLPRSSGILLHPTSLPGPYGIGSLGRAAYQFADFLEETGQSIWQVLPLGPTGYGDSPYQSFSAFAGNPLLIDLEVLVEEGLLTPNDLSALPKQSAEHVDFGAVLSMKLPLLRSAYGRFLRRNRPEEREAFHYFCENEAYWLNDYALFMAAKQAHNGAVWTEWEPGLAAHERHSIGVWTDRLRAEIEALKYRQFLFSRQWTALKHYCNARNIRLMGDVPIYVAHDSADVWAHREMFHLDERGDPTHVAGVPPDYFSATGQRWGNPLYRWDSLAERGFDWWVTRIRATLHSVDLFRLDHFRGFESYWEVPATEATAEHGRWAPGPGAAFFEALERELGEVPIVAEDLGLITDEVRALRDQFSMPGMAILQFAFGGDVHHPFLPHNFDRNVVAYTGTHDNETMTGWWNSSQDGAVRKRERAFARRLLGTGKGVHWRAVRLLLSSVADTVILPLQDVLGVGNEGRMNTPGNASGNWSWRCGDGMLNEELRRHLGEMTDLYARRLHHDG